jgi:aspartyl-tRNA(Asn)/glutamyl-tRNA(Gln) amidotransferase subunit A
VVEYRDTKATIELIRSGKLTAEEHVHQTLDLINKQNKEINAILFFASDALDQARHIDRKRKAEQPLGKLAGLAIIIKSCISVQGLPVTAASRVLENHVGTYDAEVVERIKAEDGIIIGMANMDEFACGASGEHSAFGPTDNPRARGHIAGGSSSGSAASVAAGFCDLALGSDTGGSIRNPASHCGVVGIKPSYGRVSRYGLLDMSMSLDQVGAFSRDVYGAALLHSVIDGHSVRDAVTVDKPVGKYVDPPRTRLRVGVVKEFEELCTDKRIHDAIMRRVKEFCDRTHSTIIPVSLKNIKLAIQTYYPLVYTEFYSATRKYDGRKYGKKFEDAAGEEALRRVLGGRLISRAEFDGQYYRKALATKKHITEDLNEAFRDCDIIVSPVTPRLPHKIGEKISAEDEYGYDAYTIPANLAGICAASVPCTEIDGIPVGIQVMAPAFAEERLFAALFELEKLKK